MTFLSKCYVATFITNRDSTSFGPYTSASLAFFTYYCYLSLLHSWWEKSLKFHFSKSAGWAFWKRTQLGFKRDNELLCFYVWGTWGSKYHWNICNWIKLGYFCFPYSVSHGRKENFPCLLERDNLALIVPGRREHSLAYSKTSFRLALRQWLWSVS